MKTVLVIEDDAMLVKLIRLMLSEHCLLLESTSADEAFQRFRQHAGNVDVVVADVSIPGTSGIRVALELRSLNPSLKVILTSGYPPDMWPDQDAAELTELPSDSVATLQKPFPPAALLTLVQRLTSPLCKSAGAGNGVTDETDQQVM